MKYILLGLLLISCLASAQEVEPMRMAQTSDQKEKSGPVYIYWDAICASRINLDSGITVLNHIIEHAKLTANPESMFEGYFGLGATYSNKGEYNKAKDYYYRALSYSVRTKHAIANTCRVFNNIGNSYLWQGNYQLAASYCFKAAQLAERQPTKDRVLTDQLVRIYNNIATALLYMNEYQRTLYYLNKAESLAHELNHGIRLPSILNNKAMVYKMTGESEISRKYYDSALQLARHFRHFQEEYVALYGIANYLIDNHHSEAAIPYLNAASEIKEFVNPSYTARTLSALGNIYLLRRDHEKAGHYFRQALKKGEEAQALDCILTGHKQLASLYVQTKDYARAYTHMQISYRLNDSLLNRKKTEAVSLMEVKYRTEQKDREIVQKQLFIKNQERKIYKKNTWIWITSLSILLMTSSSLFLFVLYRNNRHKQSFQEERIRGMEQEHEIRHLRDIMEGEEKERSRIARELHDGIGGMLAAVKMNLSSLQKQCEPLLSQAGNQEHMDRFTQILNMLNETGSEIRETAHNLMPDILIRHGLTEALKLFCDKINQGNRLYLNLQIHDNLNTLAETAQLSVYRIIQELIQNILKHAEASNALICITVREKEDTLHILIRDNGKGFHQADSISGVGIQNIKSRIQSMQGSFQVESTADSGTTVQIRIKISNPKILSNEHSDCHSG